MNQEFTVCSLQSSADRRDESRGRSFPASPLPAPRSPLRERSAFTLVEMLIVVALIGIMAAMITPSLQGLFGVAGRRGGVNTLSGAIEQARLAAIESGVSAYVGFPTSATNKELAYSSVIVFRAKRDGDANNYVPLSRWMRFPTGVFLDKDSIGSAVTTNSVPISGLIPKLGDQNLANVSAIEFDRFGRMKDQNKANAILRVGEGVLSGDQVTFRPSTNNHYALSIIPLTGRVQISDASTNP